jgi:hypothetical protein
MRTVRYSMGGIFLLAVAQIASAQTVFNPNPPISAPYSRPALSPYLNMLRGGDPAANYYLGVMTEYDRRYRESRIGLPTDTPSPYFDPLLDDRNDLDVRERTLPPTGHQAGFMIYNAYFRIPNQRAFIPYNPNTSGNRPINR